MQSIYLFLFLSSKPSRKHLDTVVLTSSIRGRAAYICITRRKINRGNWDLSSACILVDTLLWAVPGDSWEPRRNVSAPTNPCGTCSIHPRAGRKKSHYKALHGEKQGTYAGLLLCLWDKNSNSLPLYIQIKITEYLPLKLKDTDGCFELTEKAKDTGFSYKVS